MIGAVARRLLIVDDHPSFRESARLLEDAGLQVVGQAGNAEELMRKVTLHTPDVAIVDIRMPPNQSDEGLRAAHEIRERFPGVGVLLLSHYVDEQYAVELFDRGPA